MAKKDCGNTGLYQSLEFCQGQTVLPGIRKQVLALPKRDIVKWPVRPSAKEATDMAKIAVYQGDFVLAADKKWLKVDLISNKGNLEAEVQGEKPSRTFLNKITVTHPGVEEEATGFAAQAVADDLVYLIPQRNGKYRVMGNEMYETDTKPKQALGEGTTGESGTQLEIEVTDLSPAPFYPGKIETEDGDINGATGLPWVEEP